MMKFLTGEKKMTKHFNDSDDPYAPRRFRRNKIDGRLGGVCAGIADYTGIDTVLIRILAVIGLFMSGGAIIWLYMALWIFVPKDHRAPYYREEREAGRARREARRAAQASDDRRNTNFRDVKSKFRSLEARLAGLERAITSSEWQLRRDFKDLES